MALTSLLVVALWLAVIIGWFMNLYNFAMALLDSAPVTTLFIGQGIGIIVAPLGAILGWLV